VSSKIAYFFAICCVVNFYNARVVTRDRRSVSWYDIRHSSLAFHWEYNQVKEKAKFSCTYICKQVKHFQGPPNLFRFSASSQVARFFLVQTCRNGKKYTKWPQTIPNGHICIISNGHTYIIPIGHKLYQTAVKYANIFHSKALQNVPKLGFLVLK
jgi:hypothetical protein